MCNQGGSLRESFEKHREGNCIKLLSTCPADHYYLKFPSNLIKNDK
jgi:hypothetical protein